jgi:hypothetical protein
MRKLTADQTSGMPANIQYRIFCLPVYCLKHKDLKKHNYCFIWVLNLLIPVDEVRVCNQSPAETVGLNPTGSMDVCLL